jgi:hypothetical protein
MAGPTHARRLAHRLSGPLALVALWVATLTLVPSSAALAQSPATKLALLPVGQPGSFFDLTLVPGETRPLAVQIANDGGTPLVIRTYAADVYTIINGGFGARLRDEPRSGTTTWLDYPTQVQQLQIGQSLVRTFTVNVPMTAAPGEYITSLVLENDQPTQNAGAVVVGQINRQAVAVVVTVPGPRSPALEVGVASQRVVNGSSIVDLAVANTGNVRLKPLVDLSLWDAAGDRLSQVTIQMDTFYAHTDTFIEVPLAAPLPAGAFTVRVSITDTAQGVRMDVGPIALLVTAAEVLAPGVGATADLTSVEQPAGQGSTLPLWALILLGGLLSGGAVTGLGAVALLRWRRRD